MNKNYDELSSEEKEALIELCKDDPATFIETVLGIELLEYQKVYVRETFEALKKQDKFDWRAHYFGEPYKCKVCGGTFAKLITDRPLIEYEKILINNHADWRDKISRTAIAMRVSDEDVIEAIKAIDSSIGLHTSQVVYDELQKLSPTYLKDMFDNDNEDSKPGMTDAEIRKRLKYTRNPMEIKQLNRMLSRKCRGKYKDDRLDW